MGVKTSPVGTILHNGVRTDRNALDEFLFIFIRSVLIFFPLTAESVVSFFEIIFRYSRFSVEFSAHST